MTALGRLTSHAIKEPGQYLRWPLTIITVLAIGFVVWRLATSGRSTAGDVWLKLESAKTSEDRVNLAKEYPKTTASSWALIQAAKDYYRLALEDLPQNRDVAMPTAKKALDLFDQVVSEAPHDSPQARAAALGKARVLELRNDLPKAIEQYQLVAKEWPGTPEAEDAKRFETALRDPEAEAFYKDFQAYSPTKMTLPPLGTESLPSSLLGPISPPTTTSGTNAPFGPLNPMPNPAGNTSTSPPAEPVSKGLPEVRIEPRTPTVKAPAEAATPKIAVPTGSPKMEPSKPAPAPKLEPAKPTPAPKVEASKPAPAPKVEASKPVSTPKMVEPPKSGSTPKTEPTKPSPTPKAEPTPPSPTPKSESTKPMPTPKADPAKMEPPKPAPTPKAEPAKPAPAPKAEPAKPAVPQKADDLPGEVFSSKGESKP